MAHIQINGTVHTAPVGTRLSDLLGALPCGGQGICGQCRVLVQGAVNPLTPEETIHLTPAQRQAGERLACRVVLEGDCRVQTLYDAPLSVVTDGGASLSPGHPAFSHYGIAVDIGTTTLAGRLYDPSGRVLAHAGTANPQRQYGADVLSRVQAAREGQLPRLTAAIREALNQLTEDLCRQATISPKEVEAAVVTGNTVMLTLLTGRDVEPFAKAPFTGFYPFGETQSAQSLGLHLLQPLTPVYLPTCVGAFIGADILCGMLACGLPEQTDTTLMADIGTNGEMVLWHRGQLFVCSTAAGPAFEGIGVRAGMPGCDGAIHRVEVAGGRLYPYTIGGGQPLGLCGSGIVDAVACLLQTGALDTTGRLDTETEIAAGVTLTGEDVQTILLSKSAVLSGMQTLLHRAQVSPEDIRRLCLAGGFGSCLNPANARLIGLLPPVASHRIHAVGNSALDGAASLLLDTRRRQMADALAATAQTVELATDPYFAKRFIGNMSF